MRSRLNILVAAAAAILVVPQLATADSVEDQLQLMNERMGQLEDQLQATQDELDASTDTVAQQGEVIEKAGLDRQAKSGLSSFYDQVQISGWLAASYFFNANNPKSAAIEDQQDYPDHSDFGTNTGVNALVAPFHPDHNSFSVDQLWFEVEKPVTEESRGGFRADLVWGKTASILRGDHLARDERDTASDFNLYQAYVQYLTPFGPTLKAGKFGTLIGYEVAATVYNFNITRGLVYTALQPINHYGLLLEGQTDGGIVYALGVVNDASGIDPDNNNSKNILARLGWAGEKASLVANMLWGNESPGNDSDPYITVDLVGTFDPTESFSTWVNFTYQERMHTKAHLAPPGDGNASGWGIATAGRYAFTDRLGLAMRLEFIQDNRGLFNGHDMPGFFGSPTDLDAWGVTMTTDFAVTDNLTLKAEARYDWFDFHNDSHTNEFIAHRTHTNGLDSDNFTNRDQWLTGLELVYQF